LNGCQGGRAIPAELQAIIKRDFEDPGRISRLAEKFLICPQYNRAFFQLLLRTARGKAGESWSLRCFALSLMERQLSALSRRNLPEFDKVLAGLGLKRPGKHAVAAELIGWPEKMPLAEFVPRFLRKLRRRRGRRHPGVELADLLHRSTQECKLVLSPCVFTPKEVFERILMQVKVSAGVLSSPSDPVEKRHAGPFSLSTHECQILRRLQRSSQIYWVSDSTSSRINSLVEYPLGAAVLVLKLPGSNVEFELKRAGKRDSPLEVLFSKNGKPVPVSHRLQGGGTGWMLESESKNESRFCSLFRAIHHKEPPMSRTLLITNVNRIPCKSGTTDLLTWFTDANAFGAGYQEMRSAMRRCLKDGGSPVPAAPLAQTVAFLRDAQPRQSVLGGTSSFRLDRLSQYLSPLGPKHYFDDGLGVKWTCEDARQFADDLLDEALGSYVQPNADYGTHEQYLKAAFSIPKNRAIANANYLFCMEQIGLVWGTMLAIGSYSIGESFVPRNAGLKAVWQEDAWSVKIIFMDHDCLESPAQEQSQFPAAVVIDGTIHDETHIFGHALPHRTNVGAVTCLQDIYRITKPWAEKGSRQLRGAMLRSFCKARACAAKGLLPSAYLAQLLDFEEVVRMSINPNAAAKWEPQAMSWLLARGYTRKRSHEYQQAVKKHARFFREHAFLYQLPFASH
jgi:hypothetical protein